MNIVLQEGAIQPKKQTKHSAGYDLHSMKDCLIPPLTRYKVPTGVHFDIPHGTVGTISHRSGMNTNLGCICYGRVDSDYIGEVFVTLFNMDASKEVRIRKGDRIAQIVFVPVSSPILRVVSAIHKVTKRGESGYGSTGR